MSLQKFMQEFRSGDFRLGHQFRITVDAVDGSTNDRLSLQAQSTIIPGKTIEPVETQFMGFTARFPGVVKWDGTWNISVKCDSDMVVYNQVEVWMNEFSNLAIGGGGNKSIPSYRARVDLLGADLETIKKTIVVEGIFPTSLGEITLEQSNADIATFELGLAYQYTYDESNGDPIQ